MSVLADILAVFQRLYLYIAAVIGPYIPEGAGWIFLILAIVSVFVGIFVYIKSLPTASTTQNTQLQTFRGVYTSLGQTRLGVDDLLATPAAIASQNNWVLLNFAPLTVRNAGYLGPEIGGVYSTEAIRQSLELGFRCFVFNIDYYTGSAKDPNNFVAPGEPCLLHRDSQGVIRSENCGKIDDMITALSQQAFSPSLPTGKDPLIVLLNFKNTPDPILTPVVYQTFLSAVSTKIQSLRRNFLTKIGETTFSNMSNQNLLFTQNFQSLRQKTLIFTNISTDLFAKASVPIEQNLRSMINAQVYSGTGSAVPGDPVTVPAPKGTTMSIALQTTEYYLNTPSQQLAQAQASTNNVYTLCEPSGASNIGLTDITKLLKTYGVQMITWNMYTISDETIAFLKQWGQYSWTLKPPEIQFVVVHALPPKPLTTKADAKGGNVAQPALHF